MFVSNFGLGFSMVFLCCAQILLCLLQILTRLNVNPMIIVLLYIFGFVNCKSQTRFNVNSMFVTNLKLFCSIQMFFGFVFASNLKFVIYIFVFIVYNIN